MITVKSLDFRYANSGKHAVNDMSFEIGKGEIFGFLGPSGAGKTTVQRLIIGLLRNYGGSIEVMGKERKSWNKDFFESIGVAFDFPNLFLKLSAGENLRLIGSYYRNKPADIKGLLDRVGLLPDINTRTENFSKGMKMRLNFVRAIMHQPELLFLDEPTSGLDPVNAHIIKEIILEEKRKGRTIFLTTHNMTVAEQLCDRVAFVNEGKIVATVPVTLLTSGIFTLCGVLISAGCRNVNQYLLKSIPYMLLFVLPCFSLIGFPYSEIFMIVPPVPALKLMLGAYVNEVALMESVLILLYLTLMNYAFFRWATAVFEKRIVFEEI